MRQFHIFDIFEKSFLVSLSVKEHWLKSNLFLGLIYFIMGSTFFELLVHIYIYICVYIFIYIVTYFIYIYNVQYTKSLVLSVKQVAKTWGTNTASLRRAVRFAHLSFLPTLTHSCVLVNAQTKCHYSINNQQYLSTSYNTICIIYLTYNI